MICRLFVACLVQAWRPSPPRPAPGVLLMATQSPVIVNAFGISRGPPPPFAPRRRLSFANLGDVSWRPKPLNAVIDFALKPRCRYLIAAIICWRSPFTFSGSAIDKKRAHFTRCSMSTVPPPRHCCMPLCHLPRSSAQLIFLTVKWGQSCTLFHHPCIALLAIRKRPARSSTPKRL